MLTYDQSNPLYSVIRGGMVGHTLQAIPTWEQYDENRTGGYGGLYGDVVNLTHPLGMVDDNLMKRYSDNVKIFAKFLSTIRPKQNHESIGINENIAELKAILNNLFICSPLFMKFFN